MHRWGDHGAYEGLDEDTVNPLRGCAQERRRELKKYLVRCNSARARRGAWRLERVEDDSYLAWYWEPMRFEIVTERVEGGA